MIKDELYLVYYFIKMAQYQYQIHVLHFRNSLTRAQDKNVFQDCPQPNFNEESLIPEIARTVYIHDLEYIGIKGDLVYLGVFWLPNPSKLPHTTLEKKQEENLAALVKVSKASPTKAEKEANKRLMHFNPVSSSFERVAYIEGMG